MTDTESEAVAWILRADTGTVRLWTQDRGFSEQKAGDWEAATEPLFPASSLASRDARIATLEALLEEAVKALELVADSPSVPVAYQWSGDDGLEGMFDPELRHKNGSKAPDYLKAWLSMFRPFAVASRSDSWGELEKLICIVMRNYVRMAAKNAQARATLTTIKGGE